MTSPLHDRSIGFWSESPRISRAITQVLRILNIPHLPHDTHDALIDYASKCEGVPKLVYVGGALEVIVENQQFMNQPIQVLWCPLRRVSDGVPPEVWCSKPATLVSDILRFHKCASATTATASRIEGNNMNHDEVKKNVQRILGYSPSGTKKAVLNVLIHELQNAVRDGEKNKNNTRSLDVLRVTIDYAKVKQVGDLEWLAQLEVLVENQQWDNAIECIRTIDSGRRVDIGGNRSTTADEDGTFSKTSLPEVVVLFVDDRNEEFEWFEREVNANIRTDLPFRIKLQCQEFDSVEEIDRFLREEPSCQALIIDWNLSESVKGDECIKCLRARYPNLLYCILTRQNPVQLLRGKQFPVGVRSFEKRDPTAIASLYQHVVQSIKKRMDTPFFFALKQYSQRPVSVFHAQITSGGKSLRKSSWLGDFYDFYGQDVFNGETTTTSAPLDSLLEPKGSIKAAQDLAAEAFGAERTFFVTNGTSTAVKILYQALLKPGDTVLIDRCCHKSHHYGLVLSGASPAYLPGEPLNLIDDEGNEFGTGIWKGVTTEKIVETLDAHPNAKMLSLTNCTFDGYIHQTEKIVQEVIAKLWQLKNDNKRTESPDDFVFLFDEAWFAYATFLPDTRGLTAMAVAQKFPYARIYSVQSTHKTLTAFRQGSMIHARDPYLSDHKRLVYQQLKESLFTHTTTSPSYNMIASLDAGRMQADLEVRSLWTEAWNLAADLRTTLEEDTDLSKYFGVLTPQKMGGVFAGGEIGDKQWYLDASKVTLLLKPALGLTGEAIRKLLLDKHNIHFNKSTSNTCLLMVNGGSTSSSVSHLIQALRDLAATREKAKPGTHADPIADSLLDVSFPELSETGVGMREYFFGMCPSGLGDVSEGTFDIHSPVTRVLVKQNKLLSRVFVIPYPPGFPVLVPGQIITEAILDYLAKLDVSEVHGMNAGLLAVQIAQPSR
jgi:arginine/lysine/ornithine decarboxylase